MTSSRIINIEEIGPVIFVKSRRAKRVIISIRPLKTIRIAVPMRTSLKKAVEFIYYNKEWIQRQLVKIEKDAIRNKPIRDLFSTIGKDDAKKKLKDRLSFLAATKGFIYNKVFIRNQKTRWGSCSSKNNISLNLKLILLPSEFIDYVILHELVHTQIHNHSRKFWFELDKYSRNSRVTAKRLKMEYSGLL